MVGTTSGGGFRVFLIIIINSTASDIEWVINVHFNGPGKPIAAVSVRFSVFFPDSDSERNDL